MCLASIFNSKILLISWVIADWILNNSFISFCFSFVALLHFTRIGTVERYGSKGVVSFQFAFRLKKKWMHCINYKSGTSLDFLTSFKKDNSRCRIAFQLNWKHTCNFIEITLWHGCSPVNLLHISEHLLLRTPLGGCFWRALIQIGLL